MKLKEKMTKEKNQIYALTVVMYVIGALADWFGYINTGVDVAGFMFLTGATIFSIALSIMWSNNNKKLLRAAKIHLSFVIIGIIIMLLTFEIKMYLTFTSILVFTVVIAFNFIFDLIDVADRYNNNNWE